MSQLNKKTKKNLDLILMYFENNRNHYFDIQQVCTELKIEYDDRLGLILENDGYIENVAQTMDGDGYGITESGRHLLRISGGYANNYKFKKNRVLGLPKWLFRGIITSLIGGIILILFTPLFQGKGRVSQDNCQDLHLEVYPFRINVSEGQYNELDTIPLVFHYMGCPAIINNDVKLTSYTFMNKSFFYTDNSSLFEPEISIIEVLTDKEFIDSVNPKATAFIQIKKKIIMDGYRAAWFDVEDKVKIGQMTFEFHYEINHKQISDSTVIPIYIEKPDQY